MDAGAILLWPELEDLYTLMCMRVEGGRTAFEREKQNSPINPDLCEWPESYFDESIWFESWPANLAVKTMGRSEQRKRLAPRRLFRVRHARRRSARHPLRRSRPGAAADARHGGRRRRVVPPLPARRIRRRSQSVSRFAGQRIRVRVPPARHFGRSAHPIENHTSKQVRIRRLGPYLSSHRIRFKSDSPGTSC